MVEVLSPLWHSSNKTISWCTFIYLPFIGATNPMNQELACRQFVDGSLSFQMIWFLFLILKHCYCMFREPGPKFFACWLFFFFFFFTLFKENLVPNWKVMIASYSIHVQFVPFVPALYMIPSHSYLFIVIWGLQQNKSAMKQPWLSESSTNWVISDLCKRKKFFKKGKFFIAQ